ncbi:DUF1672 family protein [Bacillus sp. E(2018)]|uniref:DUF1672 family protein n=1 Tax=Bacillus sp. E(2018) TaxID=2502239 RepID=UPI0010F6EAC7|nr:DUF1672 family protein [Bacillus sp. E(2018)]
MINKRKTGMITFSLVGILLLGGCLNGTTETVKKEDNHFVSVQNYTGQGFDLPKGEDNDKIAEANRDKVISSTEKFFLETYKTKVKVHNIVGNKDGASVFVESIEKPHFHTFAVIPIDNKGKVRPEGIWTEEGQVELSIKSGLYAMIYEEQLTTLDTYLEGFVKEHPVVGKQEEAIQKTSSTGFTTPYYYISIAGESLDGLYEAYINNPQKTKKEWQAEAENLQFSPEDFLITIQLYMKEKGAKPDQKIFDQLVADLEKMDNLSPGSYSVILNDNTINKGSAENTKENKLERNYPNEIKKP